jgi:phage-related protein
MSNEYETLRSSLWGVAAGLGIAVVLVLLLTTCGCGWGIRKPSISEMKASIQPETTVAPEIKTEGDVQQTLETIQATLTDMRQDQGSIKEQSQAVAESIGDVASLVQETNSTVSNFDIGPAMSELWQHGWDRLIRIGLIALGLGASVAIGTGLLGWLAPAPALNPLVQLVGYIAAGVLIVLPVIATLAAALGVLK